MATRNAESKQQIETPSIPSGADFPDIVAAELKLAELREREADLQNRLSKARQEYVTGSDLPPIEHFARNCLATGIAPAIAAATECENIGTLDRDLKIAKRTIELQLEAIRGLYCTHASDASKTMRPAYLQLVKSAASHLAALHRR